MVKKHKDSTNAWKILKDVYKSKELTVILNLNHKLLIVKYQNFTSIEEFLKKACEIKLALAYIW